MGPDRRVHTSVVTAGLLAAVLLATHLLTWVMAGFFEPLRARATDRLFAVRAAIPALRPDYDERLVHVVIDDAAVRARDGYYVQREDYAQLVRTLARAGVVTQFHDVIFAAPLDEEGDRALEEATREAGNVYYGLGAGLSLSTDAPGPSPISRVEGELPAQETWPIEVVGDPVELPRPYWFHQTYERLISAAKGSGFLDLMPDGDGVYREAFTLAQTDSGVLPSAALIVAGEVLQVPPERIRLGPGRSLTLQGALAQAGGEPRDVVVPLGRDGQIIVNFVGPWGTMVSYPFTEIYAAAHDRFTMEDLRDHLQGKIAIVSWLTTGNADIGAVPIDPTFPRAAIHANVINSLLTGQFLQALTAWQMLLMIELPLLLALLTIGSRLPAIAFALAAAGLALVYVAIAAALFLWGGLLVDIPGPLIFVVGSTVVVASYRFHLESEARARLDRDMALARDIQFRTFPGTMPDLDGYDVAGRSEPADETGGDTYDVIRLDEHRLLLLLGDATGHGLGPALSVTQVRSMLRIAMRLDADLDVTLKQINDQLADDLASNRFVTAFLGILDTRFHTLTYHAAGQGPLMHFKAATGEFEWYDSTTMPMGLMEQVVPPTSMTVELGPGDVFGVITDGLYEYEDRAEEQYGQDRAEEIVRRDTDQSAERIMESLFASVHAFGRGVPQADDITMLVLRRAPGDNA